MIAISMETSYYLLLLAFLYLLTNKIIRRFQNLPPSPPFSLPLIGHLHLIKKPLHRRLAQISDKYGPILLLHYGSRPVILVSSPSAVEECFTKNDITFANRPKLLAGKYIGNNFTTMSWASYGQHWRNLRKIAATEILSTIRIQMYANIRSHEVLLLIQRLLARASITQEHGVVDMKLAFFELTMNIMMRMIAGKRYYGEDDGDIVEESARYQELLEEILQAVGLTSIGEFVPQLEWIGRNKLESKLGALQAKRDKFMQELIEERRRIISNSTVENKNKTMIDVLLYLQETEPEYYTDEIIRGMIYVMLSAGSETTSAAMEWALSLLLNNPKALKKAQQEIDTQIGQSRLISDSDIGQLPYLQAVIKETLRMNPPGPVVGFREASEECTVGGFRIPRGSCLLANLWAIQNDTKIWEEPTKFKPERFLNLEGHRDGFVFLPFGFGRRACPGENLAKRVAALALGSLIQCFDWERPGEKVVDMTEGHALTLRRAHPLLARCRPRPQMVKLVSQL